MASLISVPFYHLVSFTTVGTHTWTPDLHTPPDTGYEVDYYIVTCYGGGEGGDRATDGYALGGRNGGRIASEVSVAEAGTSQTVTVGAGGAGRSGSNGQGGAGGVSKFGSLVESVPGASAIPSLMGDIPSSACPGDGGMSAGTVATGTSSTSHDHSKGSLSANTSTGNITGYTGSNSHSHSITDSNTPGGDGGSSSGAAGGTGSIPGGWFGIGATGPTNGADGVTKGWYTTGGGGGGGTQSNFTGGNGGAPGGGGGGAKGATAAGNGGRGQVDVLAVYKPSVLGL